MKNQWRVAYAPHKDCAGMELQTIQDIQSAGLKTVPAIVPGNIELDLIHAGLLDPIYESINTLKAQELENLHLWYYTTFQVNDPEVYLHFDGIDTLSDIYVNGKLIKSTDNMFLSYDAEFEPVMGENELVVHIKPVCIEARKKIIPAESMTQRYNYPALSVRKASHMFGWDIMPRIVSAGIWKAVALRKKQKNKIREVFLSATRLDLTQKQADMRFYIHFDADGDFIQDYTVKVSGACGESHFSAQSAAWHNSFSFQFPIENCKPWWPKHAGEQNLYHTTVELYYKDTLCDQYTLDIGIRMVELLRTDYTDEKGSGEFVFKVNGKKIFVLGTNWVPLDALHSQDAKRLDAALALLDGIGCNMVRCWGGNVYESDEFFNFCDQHGILVWQDFSMACAVPPLESDYMQAIEEEAVFQVKRLRNHASLTLWAGDNENDVAAATGWFGPLHDPNDNLITRALLKKVLLNHDQTRPYLPSSPYVSEQQFQNKMVLPEDHLWGPRDYFKGDYYRNTQCHFASETGYHGFPSPQSLRRFLKEPERIFDENGTATDEYLVHAASMETDPAAPYAFRIRLAYDQVKTLFTKAEDRLEDFVRQSQISQAEAKKYFIERFRISKWRRTGIIWWNLLDGWPQVSDAVVDYYHTKKLAYHYIKRSQEPVCLMFDEPKGQVLELYGVNDLPVDAEISYTVKNITKKQKALQGSARLPADTSAKIGSIRIPEKDQSFYLIQWSVNGKQYQNHYITNLLQIDYHAYIDALKECGMDEFEGF